MSRVYENFTTRQSVCAERTKLLLCCSATCPLCRRAVVIEGNEEGGVKSTEDAQALEPASRPPASYSDASEGVQQSGSERSSTELPADSMPMQAGLL